jgi:ribonuclease BN (tRNA processing enzyme)
VVQVDDGEQMLLALVDPGAGSSHRLAACGYDFGKLTHVLFSHYHPDHHGDLVPILFALQNPRFQSVGVPDPVKLIGPRGLHDLHRALRGVYGSWIDLENRVRIQEVHPGHRKGFFSIGPIEVTCFSVDHTDNSVAYRFESRSGKVLAYSGDTDRCSGVVEAGRGADVFILECSFPEGEKRSGHLTPSEAGQIATAANARRVILTHLYPECWGKDLITPCRQHFQGEVQVAEDGLTVYL